MELEVASQGGGWGGRGRRRSEATTGRWLVAVGPDGPTGNDGEKGQQEEEGWSTTGWCPVVGGCKVWCAPFSLLLYSV